MKNLSRYLSAIFITAWVGSLWAIGHLAVPILFHAQPDRQLAGMLAGQMFTLVGYLGIFCGTYLLLRYLVISGRPALRLPEFWTVSAMLLLALAIQFGIQPVMADLKTQALPLEVMQSTYADRFKMLHGLSSIAFLIQSLLGAFLVVRTSRA